LGDAQPKAPETYVATQGDRYADCHATFATATRLETRYLWSGWDNPAEERTTLMDQAKAYRSLTLLHPTTQAAVQALSDALTQSVQGLDARWKALSAPGDPSDAQRKLLLARSPEEPRRQIAAACEGVEAPSEPSPRVLCADLAEATYTGLRFAVVGTDKLAQPALEKMTEVSAKLGPKAAAFAKAQRKRQATLREAAERRRTAPTSEQEALHEKQRALLAPTVAETARELHALCPAVL
jgi:hypothetical protein